MRAGFRIQGLKYHEKLYQLINASPYYRFLQGSLSATL
jgi:hypothetical protein